MDAQVKWTTEAPTEEGLYWWRREGERPSIVERYIRKDGTLGSVDPFSKYRVCIVTKGGEWAGPILPPE